MIILDTNVLSEPLRPEPDPVVMAWLDAQEPQTLYITAVSLAELFAGVAARPSGKRRGAHGFMRATRNVQDFIGTGVEVFNPWPLTS